MALLNVDFFSEVIGMCMQMEVILPERTRGQIGMQGQKGSGKIPVLYLLHGMSDDHTIWLRRTSIERYVSSLGIAVIMPTTHLGWYTDMAYGNRYWTYISEELPKICHSFFADLSEEREDTFAAGLSMGGYGALKLGLGTDRFGAVASLSGAVKVGREASDTMNRQPDWQGVCGDMTKIKGSGNDLFRLAKEKKERAGKGEHLPKIYMCCGTEDRLLEDNRDMKKYLEENGYDLTYEESPGNHEWGYWDVNIQKVLAWLPIHG